MRRLLSRYTVTASVAAVTVIAAAVYATGTRPAAPPPQIAVRAAAVEQVDQALQHETGSANSFDVNGLIQQAIQLGQTGASTDDLIQQLQNLLRQFGIDPNAIQSFLDEITDQLTPQQLSQDAADVLTGNGVAAGDIQELRSELIQVPSAPAQVPGWVSKVLTTLGGLVAKYWYIAAVIVAVTVALVIFGARSQQRQKKPTDGPGCNLTKTDLDTVLTAPILSAPKQANMTTLQPWTTGTAFVPQTDFKMSLHSGEAAMYDEPTLPKSLFRQGTDILQQAGRKEPAVDVEQKLATYMRLSANNEIPGLSVHLVAVCLVINNYGGVCSACQSTVPLLFQPKSNQSIDVNWKDWKNNTFGWRHMILTA